MTPFQRIIKYLAVAFALFLVISIFSGIFGALGLVSGLVGSEPAGETRSYPVTGEIENLDLEISAAALKIIPGDRFSVESNHKYLQVAEKDGTLKISEEKVLFGASSEGISVVLTVPEGFRFRSASLETGAGKVDITQLAADNLSLDLGAGAAQIDSLTAANRCEIDTGTGKVSIGSSELHDLRLSLGVGKLALAGRITGKSSVDFGVGGGDLTLTGSKDDYQIHLDKGIGDATVDGMVLGDGSVYGSGGNRIDIDGGIGSISIRFQPG